MESDFVEQYLEETRLALDSLDRRQIQRIIGCFSAARDSGQQIFAVGNGGSASTASHFVNDLGKGASLGMQKRFKVISLTDNVEWMTALSNDLCYEDVFVEQLRNFAERGDLLLAISGSGNSENVLRAVEYMNDIGGVTIGFSGRGGGRLREAVQDCVVVASDHMGRIEDLHLLLQHIICYSFVENSSRVAVGA